MRKSLICLALAASVASVNIQAQVVEQPGGTESGNLAEGGVNVPVVAAGYLGAALMVGLVANSNGNSPVRPVAPPPPPPPPPPPLTCSGDDDLVDGVCINTTVTVTVTGTGTVTGTITVPVSSTYAPTN